MLGISTCKVNTQEGNRAGNQRLHKVRPFSENRKNDWWLSWDCRCWNVMHQASFTASLDVKREATAHQRESKIETGWGVSCLISEASTIIVWHPQYITESGMLELLPRYPASRPWHTVRSTEMLLLNSASSSWVLFVQFLLWIWMAAVGLSHFKESKGGNSRKLNC